MTSTHTPTRAVNGPDSSGSVSWLGQKGKPATLPRGLHPRRRVPHLLVGVLLVVVCVGGAVWWSTSTQDRIPVLAIARPVTVGHVLTQQDLRRIAVSATGGVAMVPVEQAASVVGRPMATSLTPGALLTPDSVGTPTIPAAGDAVVAVGLKPGQFPPELGPGASVRVVLAASSSGAPAAPPLAAGETSTWQATVVSVAAAGTDQTVVVSLQLPGATAPGLAQVPVGQMALVMLPGGDR